MLHGIGRILPSQIVAVRLRHQAGVVALASVGNQRLVHFVHLIIFLAGCQLAHHFLEHGIALGGLAEGVVVDGLVVQKVVLQRFVARQVSIVVHGRQMLHGWFGAVHLHIHIETLLRHPVVTGSFVGRIQFRLVDNHVSAPQQVEGLLPVVLAIVECRSLCGALRSQCNLAPVGVVVEGVDKRGACLGDVLLCVDALGLLM